jgi:hypothetical protein
LKTRIVTTTLIASSYLGNLADARARALTASSVRFLGAAVVSSELRRRMEAAAIWSTAARNAASLAFDGLLKPVTFRTNCNEAARISSSVTGGSKLKSVLMFLHTIVYLGVQSHPTKALLASQYLKYPNKDDHGKPFVREQAQLRK